MRKINAPERPNILLIMTDQQRFDSLGCTGAAWVSTPNLDRLAGQGVLFENCYTNNPVCTPARASLMTGKELPGHGVYRLHEVLPPDEIMFPERLQAIGYQTALFGKLHVSGRVEEAARRHPHDGFDVYEWCLEPAVDMDSPFNGYTRWLAEKHPEYLSHLRGKRRRRGHDPVEVSMNRWAADRAIDYIRAHGRSGKPGAGGRPFFCAMSVFDPHNPYDNYPLEMESFVDRAGLPEPVADRPPAPGSSEPWAFKAEREHSYLGPMASFSPADVKTMRLGYYAMVAHIDREIGRVLAALEESGLAGQTLVIFISDHGDMLGDHACLVKGAMLHDPCVRVPLVVRGPGDWRGGRRVKGLVQLHDLAATVLSAAGVAPERLSDWMPAARDLAELASGRTGELHEQVVCAYRNSGIDDRGLAWEPPINTTMLRRGRYKLHAYHSVPGRQERTIYKLYDMVDDPLEIDDLSLSTAHADDLADLKDRLAGWLLEAELRCGGRGGLAMPKKDQLIVNSIR